MILLVVMVEYFFNKRKVRLFEIMIHALESKFTILCFGNCKVVIEYEAVGLE